MLKKCMKQFTIFSQKHFMLFKQHSDKPMVLTV